MSWFIWVLMGLIVLGLVVHFILVRPLWARRTGIALAGVAALVLVVSLVYQAIPTNISTAAPAVDETAAMTANLKQQFEEASKVFTDKISSLENSVKAVTDKDIEQDKQIAELQGRVSTLENDMKTVKSDIADLKAGLKSVVEDGDVTVTALPDDLTKDQAAQALSDALIAAGWTADQIRVAKINWSENPYDVGNETFVTRTIKDQGDLVRVVSDPQNGAEKAVRKHILASLEGMSASEKQRALSGKGFIPVQFKDDVCYDGNTFYNAATGKAQREKDTVCRDAGDVWWVYVGSAENGDSKVYWDTAVRADCGNPGATKPPRPKHPKPKPTPTPTKPTSPTPTPTPTKPTTTPTPTPSPTKTPSEHPAPSNAPSPSVPAPSVTEPTSRPSSTPSKTNSPAPKPEPSKSRTSKPTQPPPPKETATASIDPCKGDDAKDNPACG